MKDQLVDSEGKPMQEAPTHRVAVRFLQPGEAMTIKNSFDQPMLVVGADVHYQSKDTRKSYDLVKTATLPISMAEDAFTPFGESEVTVRLDCYASKSIEHRRTPKAQAVTF